MSAVYGFFVTVTNSDLFNYKLNYIDEVSSSMFESDGVIVLVQAGMLSDFSARKIASEYLADREKYMLSRYTDGSFVIIDTVRRIVFAGRDRSQSFHLYIYEKGNNIYISTDLTAIGGDICTELDAFSVDLFISHEIVLAPFPLFKGVDAVLPGYCCIYSSGKKEYIKFWDIKKVDVPKKYMEAVECYNTLFLESIKRNISNDSAAVFLSGGSDSASVVGGLKKIGVGNVYATHMSIKGNFEFEREDVERLKDKYGFNLKYITPDIENASWPESVKSSICLGSINSIYRTFPVYLLMGKHFRENIPRNITVFNGEWCILDQGFSESSDITRHLRRWLFLGQGRFLSRCPILLPENKTVNWKKRHIATYSKDSLNDPSFISFGFTTMLQTFLHSIGRSVDYYAGLKLGFRGFPGIWQGVSLLPEEYMLDLRSMSKKKFFDFFEEGLKSENRKQTIDFMNVCWYSESSNFTMPADTAKNGNLNMCFPFSSVDLMDFASSLPCAWSKDKKIQKDMCRYFLDMPAKVAYRMKNHAQTFSYVDYVYGSMEKEMLSYVLNTDYGVLNEGVKFLNYKKILKGRKLFTLYGLAVWINEKNLRIV